jgi:ATP-dependent DNA ligase
MAARVVHKLPEGDEWTYEVKFDGGDVPIAVEN